MPNHDADLTALNMLARSDEVRGFQMPLSHILCMDLPVTIGPDKAEMLGCMSLVSKENTVGTYELLGAPREEVPSHSEAHDDAVHWEERPAALAVLRPAKPNAPLRHRFFSMHGTPRARTSYRLRVADCVRDQQEP